MWNTLNESLNIIEKFPKETVGCRLDVSYIEQLDLIAEMHEVSRSKVIEKAIEIGLERYDW